MSGHAKAMLLDDFSAFSVSRPPPPACDEPRACSLSSSFISSDYFHKLASLGPLTPSRAPSFTPFRVHRV